MNIHSVRLMQSEQGYWYWVCDCGKSGKSAKRDREVVHRAAEAHAREVKSKCGKSVFDTEELAIQAVFEARLRRGLYGNRRRKEDRAYLCHDCKGWHLTSRPLRMSS